MSRVRVSGRTQGAAVDRLSARTVRAMLERDGYEVTDEQVAQIQRAAAGGSLLWTTGRVTTLDASRLDLRPERERG